MKTPRFATRELWLLAGGFLACLPVGLAAPGGAASFGTASSAGGGHASATAAHSSGASAGARSLVSTTGSLRSGLLGPSATGYHGTTFAPGAARSTQGFPSTANASAYRAVIPQAGSTRLSAPVARVNNAWTDPAEPHPASAGGNPRYLADRYLPSRPAGGQFRHGQNGGDGFRGHHRYYNNFPYALYYPYLYDNSGYGDTGYYGSASIDPGLQADNNSTLGTPDFSNSANNYYTYPVPAQPEQNPGQPAPAQPLPDAPAVGPQDPAPADKSTATPTPSQGPDSLVEAVQNELARRGYFEGDTDAMYSPATKEAIRRFQTDQHLPATGRVNEATLHALRLD